MPTSFDALYDETRPLRLMEPRPTTAPRPRVGATLATLLLIVAPVLVVALL